MSTEVSPDGDKVSGFNGIESKTFWEHVKSNGPKLAFFFKAVAVYFVFFIPSDKPSVFSMTLKCFPILALVLFVLLHGISAQDRHSFARKILMGLMFSCLGDAFLIWPSHFPHGMAAFGIAQIFYSWAYGFKHPHWLAGGTILLVNSIGVGVILPRMVDVPVPVMVGLPVYSFLLTIMVWRAVARLENLREWTWTKVCSTVGALFFAVSDSMIGISLFVYPLPYSQALIMSTYYIAQLCIALSIINHEIPAEKVSPTQHSVTVSTAENVVTESVRESTRRMSVK